MNKSFKVFIFLFITTIFVNRMNISNEMNAASIPKLRYTSKVIYINGDSIGKYTDSCWIPHLNANDYTIKYQIINNSHLISVSKNGKVIATGNGIGIATVKVTYMKRGEQNITTNFTVKVRRNAVDIKLAAKSIQLLDTPVIVGETVKFEAAKSYDGSYAKGHYGMNNYRGIVNDTLKLESLTPEIAVANGLSIAALSVGTAKFVVKAYQYGDNVFTGVMSDVYTIVVNDISFTPTPLATPIPTLTPTPVPTPIPTVTPIPTIDECIIHEYNKVTIEPTKQGAGYTSYMCIYCQDIYIDDYMDYQPSKSQVYDDMTALMDEYFEGRAWTNDDYYRSYGSYAGYGCVGFALILSDSAFGYLPIRKHTNINDIKVGDILRINNDTHSVIVLELNKDSIIIAEGNYNSSIHWGRSLSYSTVNEAGVYVLTRYPD